MNWALNRDLFFLAYDNVGRSWDWARWSKPGVPAWHVADGCWPRMGSGSPNEFQRVRRSVKE